MEILVDNMIDEKTAKYFCIFANKDIKKFITDVNDDDKIVKQGEQLLKKAKLIKEGLNDDLSWDDFNPFKWPKKINGKLSAAKQAIISDVNAVSASAARAGASAAIDELANDPEKLSSIGRSVTDGAISSAANNQATIDTIATSAGKSAVKGAIEGLMPTILGAAAVSLGMALWPSIKNGFKRMIRTSADMHNSLAFVKFKDTSDNDWQFYFSLDDMIWKLDNMDTGEDVTKHHTIAFMQTAFAQRFMTRCKELISPILADQYTMAMILKNEKNSSTKKYIEKIIDNKDKIVNRMFTGKC